MLLRLAIMFVLAAGMPVQAHAQLQPRSVAPDNLAKYWVMISASLEASVPIGGQGMDLPGCATVSFIVEKTGRTSNIKVQKVHPAGDLGSVAASAAASLEFEPTINNAARDRVFSSLIFPFNLPPDPLARTAIMQHCAIEPLRWRDPVARPEAKPVS